jgi:hypothetical protein
MARKKAETISHDKGYLTIVGKKTTLNHNGQPFIGLKK